MLGVNTQSRGGILHPEKCSFGIKKVAHPGGCATITEEDTKAIVYTLSYHKAFTSLIISAPVYLTIREEFLTNSYLFYDYRT